MAQRGVIYFKKLLNAFLISALPPEVILTKVNITPANRGILANGGIAQCKFEILIRDILRRASNQTICESEKHGPGFSASQFSDFDVFLKQRNQFVAEG